MIDKKEEINKKRLQKILKSTLKVVLWTTLGLFFLAFSCILLIRTAWVQQLIVSKASHYVSSKTGTVLNIEKLYFTYSGNILIEGLYVEDLQKDTLVYSKKLEVGISILPLFSSNLKLNSIEWSGVRANIKRLNSDSTFNFNFLAEAFSSKEPKLVDTTKSKTPFRIEVGSVHIADIKAIYQDEITRIDARIAAEDLLVEFNTFDLDKLHLDASKIFFKNTNIVCINNYLSSNAASTQSTKSPFFNIDTLKFDHVYVKYASDINDINTVFDLKQFSLSSSSIDLGKNEIKSGKIFLNDSDIAIHLPAAKKSETVAIPVNAQDTVKFTWPEMKIEANTIKLNRNHIVYHRGNEPAKKNQFDANHIDVNSQQLSLREVYLLKDKAGLILDQMTINDQSGLQIKSLGVQVAIDQKNIAVKNLEMVTANSSIVANAKISYTNFTTLFNDFNKANMQLAINKSSLSMTDVLYFAPQLAENKELMKIGQYPVKLSANISGSLEALQVKNLNANWAKGTVVALAGKITNVTQPKLLAFDLNKIHLASLKSDIANFVKESPSYSIPATVQIDGMLKGEIDNLRTNLAVLTSDGNAGLVAHYRNENQLPFFDGQLTLKEVAVNKIVAAKEVGLVSAQLDFDGKGNQLNNLDLVFSAVFDKLQVKGYDYAGAKASGDLKNQMLHANLEQNTKDLSVIADVKADLNKENPKYIARVLLDSADIYALNLSKENIKARGNFNADFAGNPDNFIANLDLKDAFLTKDNTIYPIHDIIAHAEANAQHTVANIGSQIFRIALAANATPEIAYNSLRNHIESYLKIKDKKEISTTATDTINLQVNATVSNSPIFSQVLFPGLTRMDTVTLHISFDESQKLLDLTLNAPKVIYKTSSISNLKCDIKTNDDSFVLGLTMDSLSSGPAAIYATTLIGNYKRNLLEVDLNINDIFNNKLYHIAGSSLFKGDSAIVNIKEGSLVLNKLDWLIPANNRIVFAKNHIAFKDFKLTNQDQLLAISSFANTSDRVLLNFENFKMKTFTSFINGKAVPVDGKIQGRVDASSIFTKLLFNANIKIDSFEVYQQDLGQLTAIAKNGNNVYDAAIQIKGGVAELSAMGNYDVNDKKPVITADLDLKKVNLDFLQAFTKNNISNSTGFISGKFQLNGPTEDLKYKGNVRFHESSFKANAINSNFKINNENISITNESIVIPGLTFQDENGNSSTIKGTIGTKDLKNPTFDLSYISNNFQLINSTRADNDLFYGKVMMDVNMKVKGDLNLPIVNVKARLDKNTSMTFIVPEDSRLKKVESDGVVVFTNMSATDEKITAIKNNNSQSTVKGIQLQALIEVDPSTKFKIIMDENSGDFIEVQGEANINFAIDPVGKMNMSGSYVINQGRYDVSLYGVVKRDFHIVPGSSITWAGKDPLSANLDITATYDVKTSAYDLMSSQLVGADNSTQNKYKQVLPFNVHINIKEELLRPKISFNIDMPKNNRGALGGSVYAKLLQMEQDESELNTQVFALLVMNRFLPSGSGGTGASTSSLAKSSVSQILSGQLNSLSQKYVKFVDLNVDLNSYTDYQTGNPNEKTDLNVAVQKKLFNDRVVVKVGSQVNLSSANQPSASGSTSSNIVGDASIEYLLTPDGKYLLTGFRKGDYENVIDGQLIITGISLVLNKDYNHFYEIWKTKKPENEIKD